MRIRHVSSEPRDRTRQWFTLTPPVRRMATFAFRLPGESRYRRCLFVHDFLMLFDTPSNHCMPDDCQQRTQTIRHPRASVLTPRVLIPLAHSHLISRIYSGATASISKRPMPSAWNYASACNSNLFSSRTRSTLHCPPICLHSHRRSPNGPSLLSKCKISRMVLFTIGRWKSSGQFVSCANVFE